MECKIIWTDPALADLFDIVSFIGRDDPSVAKRVGADIIEAVELLKQFPLIGPAYPRGGDGSIREIICWKYRIFYRVTLERRLVEILTIWHGARQAPHPLTSDSLHFFSPARLCCLVVESGTAGGRKADE